MVAQKVVLLGGVGKTTESAAGTTDTSAVWSSGMIPASGAGGPGFDPRNGPFSVADIKLLW